MAHSAQVFISGLHMIFQSKFLNPWRPVFT